MENINTAVPATAAKFDELKTVAKLDVPAGQRLCRIINKGKDAVSVGALVPQLSTNDIESLNANTEVQAAIKAMLEGVQDKIVRAKLANGAKEIDYSFFTGSHAIDSIVEFLREENESKIRISKEAIESWFDADLKTLLADTLKTKGLQQKQIDETVAVFRNSFASLAARSINMNQQVKGQLEKAMALLPDDYENHIAEQVAGKLLGVQEARVELNAL